MLGIPHQRLLRSTSKYALTDITIDFEDGTDIYWARQQVGERLAAAMGNLPPGVTGGMAPITTPLGEMFMFTIEGDLPLAEKRALLDWVIRPQLRTIPGVADVNSLGGEVRTFEVVPNPQLLAPAAWPSRICGRSWRPTTATTAPAAWPMARKPCWCAPRAPSARWTTSRPSS
jgi:cobalt-zinc-cadmium resistance protein CzcA